MNRLLAPGRTLYISEGNLKDGGQWFGVSVGPGSPLTIPMGSELCVCGWSYWADAD